MNVHPDIEELVHALENASEDVEEGVDAVVAEGIECDVQRLNYAMANVSTCVDNAEADINALMNSHKDLHQAFQVQRRTIDILCLTVLFLAGLEFARSMQWL